MSAVMNRAPFVDTTLLNNNLDTIISADGVATSPGKLIRSPLTTNLVLFYSFFSSLSVQANGPYVTSFIWFSGTSCFLMNLIVFVPLILPSTTLAKNSNSLAADLFYSALYFNLQRSYL